MASKREMKVFTVEEVARHKTVDDLWFIIDGRVYDVTRFANLHPGGAHILLDYAGQDATGESLHFLRSLISCRGLLRITSPKRASQVRTKVPNWYYCGRYTSDRIEKTRRDK